MSLSTFERAKLRQNYTPATARQACHNCLHRSKHMSNSGFQCLKGGFFVTALAICDDFEPTPDTRQQQQERNSA